MAGTENGNAVYWKNGQGTALANGSDATGIAVSEPDVFVSGQSNSSAAYWKNGQLILLTQAPVVVNGITLSGSEVYCVGEVPASSFIDSAGGSNVNINSAVYWVNGTIHNLERVQDRPLQRALCLRVLTCISSGTSLTVKIPPSNGKMAFVLTIPMTSGERNGGGYAKSVMLAGVAFLCTKDAYWINGQRIEVSGGQGL